MIDYFYINERLKLVLLSIRIGTLGHFSAVFKAVLNPDCEGRTASGKGVSVRATG
jgi:hypothetical protein